MAKRIVTVKLDFQETPINVSKRGLLIWGEITTKFDGIIGSLVSNATEMNDDDFMEKIPSMIKENLPNVIDMLEIATPLSRRELEEDIDPSEALELVMAVIEANNLLKVNDQIKKMKTMFKKAD